MVKWESNCDSIAPPGEDHRKLILFLFHFHPFGQLNNRTIPCGPRLISAHLLRPPCTLMGALRADLCSVHSSPWFRWPSTRSVNTQPLTTKLTRGRKGSYLLGQELCWSDSSTRSQQWSAYATAGLAWTYLWSQHCFAGTSLAHRCTYPIPSSHV